MIGALAPLIVSSTALVLRLSSMVILLVLGSFSKSVFISHNLD